MAATEPNRETRPGLKGAEPSDYELLVRFVVSPEPSFGLALARYSDVATRDGVIARARVDAEAAGAPLLMVDLKTAAPGANLFALLREVGEHVTLKDRAHAIFVTGLESLLLDDIGRVRVASAVEELNRSRDLLSRELRSHVVLWLTDAGAQALASAARDLTDVLLTSFRFGTTHWPPVFTHPYSVPGWMQIVAPEDEPRLKREASLLEQSFAAKSGAAAAETALRLGQIRVLLGDITDGRTWLERAAALFDEVGDVSARAVTMGKVGNVLLDRGQLDEALRILRQEVLPAFEKLGDVRARAVTMGRIADVLQAQGQLDEALRIRQEEELAAFEKLGDVREYSVSMSKVADIRLARGQLDEALRVLQDEVLPTFERLGDTRDRAVTMGKIADVLQARGQLDEAMRIRQEEELPVYERLGDVRARAITLGKIADVLKVQGQLDEAMRILRKDALPTLEKLGDVRERAVTMGKIADVLQARGQLDEALRIRQEEELPVYEKLGAAPNLAIGRVRTAHTLLLRDSADDREAAIALLTDAVEGAQRLYPRHADSARSLLEKARSGSAVGPEDAPPR